MDIKKSKMNQNQKGFTKIIFAIIIIAIAGTAGYFVVNNNTATPNSNATDPKITDNSETKGDIVTLSQCLPSGRTLNDIVSASMAGYENGQPVELKKVTVGQKLAELKAECKDGKLTDLSGKKIAFYDLTGCWGALPPDYEQILQKQKTELAKLKTEFTVIEMTCNTTGIPYP